MEIFEYPIMVTPDEVKTATGLDLAEEYEQREIVPFLNRVHMSVYEGGVYATGDRDLKDRIIAAHKESVETALKRALIMQVEYEHAFGRFGTESGIVVSADGQRSVIPNTELRSKTICIDAINALKACAVNLLYAGE